MKIKLHFKPMEIEVEDLYEFEHTTYRTSLIENVEFLDKK